MALFTRNSVVHCTMLTCNSLTSTIKYLFILSHCVLSLMGTQWKCLNLNIFYTHPDTPRLDGLKGQCCQTHGGQGLVVCCWHVQHMLCPLLCGHMFIYIYTWASDKNYICMNVCLCATTHTFMHVCFVCVENMGYGLSERRLFNHISATGQWRAGRGEGGQNNREERVRR